MPVPAVPSDSWSSGEGYESFVGRLSRQVAPEFLAWLGVPPGARWLDVGSGTGALTEAVLACCAPERVVGVEPSDAFRAYAEEQVPDPRASFLPGDARALPVGDGAFDAVAAALVLNFVPDQAAALAEMCRAARPGGTVAAYVWDYAGGMPMLTTVWDAAVALDPTVAALHEAGRFPANQPEPLQALFTGAGLRKVELRDVVVPVDFAGFDDYWAPFLAGTGPAPAYVATLDDAGRGALRDAVRNRLPIGDDGSIHLTARAWAVVSRGSPGSAPVWRRRSCSTWTRSCSAATPPRSSCAAGCGWRPVGSSCCCSRRRCWPPDR